MTDLSSVIRNLEIFGFALRTPRNDVAVAGDANLTPP
jgi:hypothetical protein